MSDRRYQRLLRKITKMYLAKAVMQLPRFRRSVSNYPGARIVMYHEVPSDTAEQFTQHLAYFARAYTVVSLDRLVETLSCGGEVDNCLAITFDDGFKDNVDTAAPLLQEFGLTACFFVATQFVSLDSINRDRYRLFCSEGLQRSDQLPAMSWNDLGFLVKKGFTIGSHSRLHPNLASLSLIEALWEIKGSRIDIENHLGVSPIHFAWPFGKSCHFGETLKRAVQDAGYLSAYSAERGINRHNASMYDLKRDHLKPDWSLTIVRFFLEGGYEWLRHLRGWSDFF